MYPLCSPDVTAAQPILNIPSFPVRMTVSMGAGMSLPIHCDVLRLGPCPAALDRLTAISYIPAAGTVICVDVGEPQEVVPDAISTSLAVTL